MAISPGQGMVTEASTLSFNRLFAAYDLSTPEAVYYVLSKNLAERDKWLRTAKLIRR